MPTGTETVRVIRRPKGDKLSTQPTTESSFDVEGCQLIPRQAEEDGKGWISIDGWDVWVLREPEQEILFTDILEIRGVEYSIEGSPARYDKREAFKAIQIKTLRVKARA